MPKKPNKQQPLPITHILVLCTSLPPPPFLLACIPYPTMPASPTPEPQNPNTYQPQQTHLSTSPLPKKETNAVPIHLIACEKKREVFLLDSRLTAASNSYILYKQIKQPSNTAPPPPFLSLSPHTSPSYTSSTRSAWRSGGYGPHKEKSPLFPRFLH
jgi:hypothetical protein